MRFAGVFIDPGGYARLLLQPRLQPIAHDAWTAVWLGHSSLYGLFPYTYCSVRINTVQRGAASRRFR